MNTSYRRILRVRVLIVPFIIGAYCHSAAAQQSTNPPVVDNPGSPVAQPSSQPLPAQQGAASRAPDPAATSHRRLMYVLPDFLTVDNAPNIPPLSSGQKYKLIARNCFDPGQLMWYAALAGISQAANTDAYYGQGTAGYAQRYAVRFADGTIQDFMTRGVFPSFLHQDPRYFRLGRGSTMHRALYAVERIVITRSDSGERQFNYSEIVGGAVSGGISTYAYHHNRNISNALNTWGTQVGYDALAFLVREFWPDVHEKLHKSHHNP